jgi:hypothetical protein
VTSCWPVARCSRQGLHSGGPCREHRRARRSVLRSGSDSTVNSHPGGQQAGRGPRTRLGGGEGRGVGSRAMRWHGGTVLGTGAVQRAPLSPTERPAAGEPAVGQRPVSGVRRRAPQHTDQQDRRVGLGTHGARSARSGGGGRSAGCDLGGASANRGASPRPRGPGGHRMAGPDLSVGVARGTASVGPRNHRASRLRGPPGQDAFAFFPRCCYSRVPGREK